LKLNTTKIDTIDEIRLIRDEWNELHSRCSYSSIYNSHDYLFSACNSFHLEPDSLYFLIVRKSENNKLVAIFPFILTDYNWHRVKFHIIIYAGLNEADKPYPIIDSRLEKEAWQATIDHIKMDKHRWQFLELVEISEGLSAPTIIADQFSSFPFYQKLEKDVDSPIFDLNINWLEFWGMHKKMRKKVRKMQSDFGESMQFKILNDADGMKNYLNAYMELESKSWKFERKIGISRSDSYINFYTQFFQKLASKNNLFFGFLYIDDQLVSAEIAYTCGEIVYFSHGSFDKSFNRYSPGMVSTCLFLKYFHESRYSKGDFLAGFSHYVNPWASSIQRSFNQTIYRITPKLITAYLFGIAAKLIFTPFKLIKKKFIGQKIKLEK